MYNCEVWAKVDFGHGPVEIRCTETNAHNFHKCEVTFIYSPKVEHRNVFNAESE